MAESNEYYLRRCIQVSRESREHGNTPFGALLTDKDGNILMEQENIEITQRDATGHAETALVRRASHEYSRAFLKDCTPSRAPCARAPSTGPASAAWSTA